MKKKIVIAALTLAATSTQAHPNCDLKMESDYLTTYFCSELAEIAGPGTKLRSMTDETDQSDDGLDPMFAQIFSIQEAYRTDPRKTLELIERIKNAGGILPE